MKKVIQTCALLLATIVLSACQPTPNEPVVIEKNEENMLQQAQQTKQPVQTADTAAEAKTSLIQQQFIQYSPCIH